MANAVVTPTLLSVKEGRNFQTRSYALAVTASPAVYSSPLTLDFTTTVNAGNLPAAEAWEPAAVTDYAVLNGPVAYEFELVKGAALNNWGLKIGTAGAELTGGEAIPAAVSGAADLLIEVSVKTNKSV